MNVNQKGSVGLAHVVCDMTENGYEVFLPQHDYSAVDLIALDTAGIPKRIQVKYRDANAQGTVEIPLRSVVNRKSVKIDRTRIDGWAVYVPTLRRVLYVPMAASIGKETNFDIRVTPCEAKFLPKHHTPAPSYSEFLDVSVFWKVSGLVEDARC